MVGSQSHRRARGSALGCGRRSVCSHSASRFGPQSRVRPATSSAPVPYEPYAALVVLSSEEQRRRGTVRMVYQSRTRADCLSLARRLTLRSSGPPPAWPASLLLSMFRCAGQAGSGRSAQTLGLKNTMPQVASKLLDSALAIAIASAALYFLGVLNSEGDAAALGLPRALFHRDAWGTVAYGGEALWVFTVLMPFVAFGNGGVGWFPLIALAVAVLCVCFAAYVKRSSPNRLAYILAVAYIGLSIHVLRTSSLQMQVKISNSVACLTESRCDRVALSNRIVFLRSESAEDERSGIILSATEHYLFLLTKAGLFTMPVARIKYIETVPR
jgi:hypothetical protein